MRALLAFLVLYVASCAPSGPPRGSPPNANTTAPRADGGRVARTTIRGGTSGAYPPLSLWKDERPEGYAPDIFASFARAVDADVAWTRFTWPSLADDLRAGRFDVAVDGITVRPERSIAGRFTVPIARGGAVLLLRRPPWAKTSRTLAELDRAELRVVVNQGGHLEHVTRDLFHAASIRATPNNAAVRDLLARGEADAAMTNTFEAPGWARGIDDVEQLGPLTTDFTALWVRADRPDLAERFDTWLLGDEGQGTLARAGTRWLGASTSDWSRPTTALLAATAERLALMPFVAAAKKRTGKAIEDAAQEARVLDSAYEAVGKAAAVAHAPVPPRSRVDAFFRAQIEAAKSVQERPVTASAAYSLENDLRPALTRIAAKMAFVIVRIPKGTARADVIVQSRVYLTSANPASGAHASGDAASVDEATADRIAAAIADLGGD